MKLARSLALLCAATSAHAADFRCAQPNPDAFIAQVCANPEASQHLADLDASYLKAMRDMGSLEAYQAGSMARQTFTEAMTLCSGKSEEQQLACANVAIKDAASKLPAAQAAETIALQAPAVENMKGLLKVMRDFEGLCRKEESEKLVTDPRSAQETSEQLGVLLLARCGVAIKSPTRLAAEIAAPSILLRSNADDLEAQAIKPEPLTAQFDALRAQRAAASSPAPAASPAKARRGKKLS